MSTEERPKTRRLGYCSEIEATKVELRPGDSIAWVFGVDRFGTELRIAADWRMAMQIKEALDAEAAWAEDDFEWAEPVMVQVPDFGVNVIKAVYVPEDWKEGDPT